MWCKCGREIDRLGYHFYVCPAKNICAKFRGDVHYALKNAVAETGDYYYSAHQFRAAREEPHIKDYFEPKPIIESTRIRSRVNSSSRSHPQSDLSPSQDTFLANTMGPNRRADIAFKSSSGDDITVLVDVTTVSPIVKQCKGYIPGRLADGSVKRKTDDYNKHFTHLSTNSASLWFFAIETNGVFSKEARKFCKIMAEVSGIPNVIQTIYQRLSVAIQNSIAKQIYKALNQYTSSERNLLHAPVVFT